MKKSLTTFFALLICTFSFSALAQTEDLSYKQYEFGPLISGGLSVLWPATIPDGSKQDIRPAYTFGVLGAYAANSDIGFTLGLGYESRGMKFYYYKDASVFETITLGYFGIQPSFRFKNFLIGFNIDLPTSSSVESSSYVPSASPSTDFASSKLNTLIDIRLEGMLPLVENDFGNLYFMMQASYCLSNVVSGDGFYTVGQNFSNSPNKVTSSPLPSAQIGLSYLFSPGGKVK